MPLSKVLRSYHHSAKWTHSPHEFAEECSRWRGFRHLTYEGIRSYLVHLWNDHKKAETRGYKEQFQTLYRGHHVEQTRAEFLHGEILAAKREGFVYDPSSYCYSGDKPTTVLQAYLHEAIRYGFDTPYRGRPFYPSIPWSEWSLEPQESENTRGLAWRLGVSCYLCGVVSYGRDAFTNDKELGRAWNIEAPGWFPPRFHLPYKWRFNHTNDTDDVFLNPLCENCISSDAYRPIPKMFREMNEKLKEVS